MAIIIADHRESRSQVIRQLQEMEEIQVEIKQLSSGDYAIHETTVVERKSAADFVASIMDQRLFQQIAKMKIEYTKPMILIEGDPFSTRSEIKPSSIAGAISYITAIEGVNLVTIANPSETALMLATMARHLQEGLGYEVPTRAGKPKPSKLMSQYLVEGLPGIGPKNAQKLLNHFGSAINVFNASVEDLCTLKGLGVKTAEKLYAAIRHNVRDES